MKKKLVSLVSGLAMLLAIQNALASSDYVALIPNGNVNSCSTCHVNSDPDAAGTARNAFGTAWRFNTPIRTWNATLADLDSDGDGTSNGQELGDPDGNGTPTSGAQVTNPGVANAPPATAPAITTQPASQTVTAGADVTFSVVATGTAPLSYQWSKDGTTISGATSASLTLNNVAAGDAGSYTVVVQNNVNPAATSAAAVLTVNAAPADTAPVITTQPASQTVDAGADVTFSVVATGTAPLSYQWSKDGTAISGATSASLTLNNVAAGDAGSYTVVVQNNVNPAATSAAAVLTVNQAPPPTAHIPPVVELNAPENGKRFKAPAHILLMAKAGDPDGTIAKVEFFSGTESLGLGVLVPKGEDEEDEDSEREDHDKLEKQSVVKMDGQSGDHGQEDGRSEDEDSNDDPPRDKPPKPAKPFKAKNVYILILQQVAAGDYTITARATDDQGATTTSNAAQITVTPRKNQRSHDD
jgi:hypothetical protein